MIASTWRRLMLLAGVAATLLAVSAPAPASAAGELYAFGSNRFGQLGIATNSGTDIPNPTPVQVALPGASGPVVRVAASFGQSLAVTSTGQLYAFGRNKSGQLGIATNSGTENPNPTPVQVALPGATGPVVDVAASGTHSLAVTSTGQLYAFGENRYGQLGIATNSGTENPNPTPVQVALPGATGPVVDVAAGASHSLAVTSTGQLFAFGYNRYGQLGVATNNGTENPNPTPVQVALPGATGLVTQVAAGRLHSLAVTSTGQLYAFGYNGFGELGRLANAGSANPNPTPEPVALPGASGPVAQVAAGINHTLVATTSGQLYTFGRNRYGQLGNATGIGTADPNPTPTLVALPGVGGSVVQVAGGGETSRAVTSAGFLYAFGENLNGELGSATNSGTENPNPTPLAVAFPGAASVDTAAASTHTLAVIAGLLVATDSLPRGTAGTHYSARLAVAGGTGPYLWSASGLPGGLSIDAAGGEISGTPQQSGSSDVTLTVTDRYGIVASKKLPLAVAPRAAAAPKAPVLSDLSVSPRQLSLAGRLVRGSCKPATARNRRKPPCRRQLNLRIGFKLDAAATVTFEFARLAPGRQVRGRCAVPTRANRKRSRCTRVTPVGKPIARSAAAGADTVAITRAALPPGRYRLTVTPSIPGYPGGAAMTSISVTG